MPNWIFVLTLPDVIGFVIFGIVIILVGICVAALTIESIWRKVRRLWSAK